MGYMLECVPASLYTPSLQGGLVVVGELHGQLTLIRLYYSRY